MSVELLPTDTSAINVRFFTRPQEEPSGVSAGQIIPQCELCSCLGLVILPCFERGVVRRRIWDSEDANVSRLRTYDTPCFVTLLFLSLAQLPVEMALLRPFVIVSCRIIF